MCTDLAVVQTKTITMHVADEDVNVNMPGWAAINISDAVVNLETIFSADSCYTIPKTTITLTGSAIGAIAKDIEQFFPRPVEALLLIRER